MAHVVALDALRRALQAERLLQLAQRGVRLPAVRQPPHALLRQRVRGVALGELREMALAPPLRHVHAYRTAARIAKEALEVLRLRDRIRRDDLRHGDLRRERRRRRVVLAEERAQHLTRRRALGAF